MYHICAKWMEFFNFHPMWKITLQLCYFSLNDINKINTPALVLNSHQERQRLRSPLPLQVIIALIMMRMVTTLLGCEPKAALQNIMMFFQSLFWILSQAISEDMAS